MQMVFYREVLKWLPLVELVRVRGVCRHWKGIIEGDRDFWEQLDITKLHPSVASTVYSFAKAHVRRLITSELTLWKDLPSLRGLIVSKNFGMEDFNFPSLEVLDIRGIPESKSNMESINTFLHSSGFSKQLKTLKIGWISESSAISVFPFKLKTISGTAYPNLTHLVANGYRSLSLDSLRNLKILNLSCCSFGSVTMSVIEANSSTLEELNLRAVPDFYDKHEVILKCKNLKKINLSCTNLPLEFYIQMIETCHHLIELDLCYIEDRHQPKVKDLYKSILKKLAPQLKMIGLGGFPLYDEDCTMLLRSMPNINYIGFGGIPAASDSLVQIINFCPIATVLNLHNTLLKKPHFDRLLKNCKYVQEIDVSRCKNLPNELAKHHILQPPPSPFHDLN